MQVATIIKTGEQVEVIAVKGGWTTVHTLGADTRELKVRNSDLKDTTKMSHVAAELAMKKAERARVAKAPKAAKTPKAPKAPKAPREKKPLAERLNGVVEPLYLQFYTTYKSERKDGTLVRSMDKGDDVALQLRGQTLDQTYGYAASVTGHSVKDLKSRFEHLNPGMQRMNLGNMIRKVQREAANA